jgi:hypothetical protein
MTQQRVPLLPVWNLRFGSQPTIFHHPGRIGNNCLNEIREIVALKQVFFSKIAGHKSRGTFLDRKEKFLLPIPASPSVFSPDPVLNKELTVLFVSNLPEKGSMARCLDFYGISYSILGQKIPRWTNVEKITLINEHLRFVRTPFVAFFDCDDVFATAPLQHALEIFKREFHCKMLLMGGEVLWPPVFKEAPYRKYSKFFEEVQESKKSNHIYLNSGGWIADTNFVRRLFVELNTTRFEPFPEDDQPRFWMVYEKYYPEMLIDYECKIFQCEFSVELSLEGSMSPSSYLETVLGKHFDRSKR